MLVLVDAAASGSRIGEVIGSYRLLRIVGEGGAGVVYEAEHVHLGRRMAIKLLHREAVTKEAALRFFNEARAVNEIRHPNIIEVEDFVTADTGDHYMVMELLIGKDLRAAIHGGWQLTADRVAAIGVQVASALSAVHRVGILHRDLKPENVFLAECDGREVVKLLDFGTARFTEERGVTRAGMTMGTPQYMAPERIITNAEVGTPADIYALGMVLYECLVGTPAFISPTIANILRGHCFEAVVPPSQRIGTPVPPVLEAAIMKCLEKAPEHRFATAEHLAMALRGETPVALSGSALPRAAAARPVARRSSTHLALAALIASVALAVHLWPESSPQTAAAAAPPAPRDVRAPSPEPELLAMRAEPSPADPALAAAPAGAAMPAPAVEVRTIVVGLASAPPGAEMFLADGRSLGIAPTEATLPLATDPVALIARFADGTEVAETIVPDRSRARLVFVKPRVKKTASKSKLRPPVMVKDAARPPPSASPPADRDSTINPFKR